MPQDNFYLIAQSYLWAKRVTKLNNHQQSIDKGNQINLQIAFHYCYLKLFPY